MSAALELLLQVKDLEVNYWIRQGNVQALQGVSFDLAEWWMLVLVGESGCEKTTVAMSIMGILPENGSVDGGEIRLNGDYLVPLSDDQLRLYR